MARAAAVLAAHEFGRNPEADGETTELVGAGFTTG
jgi:hypothetical protein